MTMMVRVIAYLLKGKLSHLSGGLLNPSQRSQASYWKVYIWTETSKGDYLQTDKPVEKRYSRQRNTENQGKKAHPIFTPWGNCHGTAGKAAAWDVYILSWRLVWSWLFFAAKSAVPLTHLEATDNSSSTWRFHVKTEGDSGFWSWPGVALAVVGIWTMNQNKEDLSLCLSK